MTSITQTKEYADWCKFIDDNNAARRKKAEEEKNEKIQWIMQARKDILDGNWKQYVPFNDAIDFINLYLCDKEIYTKFLSNKSNVIALIKDYDIDGTIIKDCPSNLSSDKDVVYTAVTKSPSAIKYADIQFQTDYELAMIAVNIDGLALKHFDHFKDNEEIVIHACNNQGEAIEYASDRIKMNKHIALIVLKTNQNRDNDNKHYIFGYFNDIIKNDKECILTAIQSNEPDIEWIISDELKS